jgi:hypothetical protein
MQMIAGWIVNLSYCKTLALRFWNAQSSRMCTVPNVTRLIQPIWMTKKEAEQVLVTVNAIEFRRNK